MKKSKIDDIILIELFKEGLSALEIAEWFKCGERTVYTRLAKLRLQGKVGYKEDFEIIKQNSQLMASNQKYQDLTRISRKQLREKNKVDNALIEYNKQLIEVFSKHKLPAFVMKNNKRNNKGATGVIHVTDAHFNELVDLVHNKYDFPIASQRLKLLADKAKQYFKAIGIKNVLIAMTGDLMNSDRRLDELLSEATNRSKATFLAVNILEQFILDIAKDFQVTVANVIGNESRIAKDVGWTEIMASDNYDFTIYNILKLIFRNSDVKMLDGNLLEQIVEVSGQNILLLHGNQLKSTSMEQSIQKIKGKYTSQKVTIDFVLSGHLHSARIGDVYARGGSLVGANAYSDSALQLESRASQNLHVFYNNGTRDSVKCDLQITTGIQGYSITKELESYNAKSLDKAKKKKIVSNIV
jgi:predicted phosphodiesterase/transposase